MNIKIHTKKTFEFFFFKCDYISEIISLKYKKGCTRLKNLLQQNNFDLEQSRPLILTMKSWKYGERKKILINPFS